MEYCNRIRLNTLLVFISVFMIFRLSAQCPGASNCGDAYIFCSLNQLNGFECNNAGGLPQDCNPTCRGLGTLTSVWWGFVAQGGFTTITMTYGSCIDWDNDSDNDGLKWGIWADCACGKEIYCSGDGHPTPKVSTFSGNLDPCITYYLWISGVENDICEFTMSTGGGGTPTIEPLGFINNISSGIIEPVCEGACNDRLFVNLQKCQAHYVWYLDGKELVGAGNSNEIYLDFPKAGDYKICVTAYLGNPATGNICGQNGPKCAIVKVRPAPERHGAPRTICYEAANPFGYQWHSQLITTSGVYKERILQADCCEFDSIVQFTILPYPISPDIYYITCNNTPYIDFRNNRYYPCQDHYEIILNQSTNPNKCDSTIRLTAIHVDYTTKWSAKCIGSKTEISPNINIINPCEAGETYQFEYRWYKKSDPFNRTISTGETILVDTINEDYCLEVNVIVRLDTAFEVCSKIFCDSINESEVKSNHEVVKLTFCDSAEINGMKYFNSIQLTQPLKNKYGCDSVINTEINIQKSSQNEINLAACDSVKVNNIIYKQTGKFKQTLQTAGGCDSTLILDISIPSSYQKEIRQTACDSVLVNNISYKQSGKYKQLLQTVAGCDSILNLDLQIQSRSQTDINLTDCDSIVVNGIVYRQSGNYIQNYQNINGCDSLLNIHVNIPNSNVSPLVLFKCDSITINGKHYTKSGNYSQKLNSANGCDSILNIDLTLSKSNSANISFTSCDSTIINGQRYYQSGNYTQLLQNVNHCDSILNLDLKIQSSSQAEISQSDCDSVVVNGQSYSQTGNYTQLLKNATQCDSLLTIHFTRLKSNSTDLTINSCDSAVLNNQVYKQSGIFSQILSNADDCDSIINLSINIAKSNSANLHLSSCDSAIVNGKKYVQSGNYTQILKNVNHCDSTLNINLNISQSSSTNFTISSCDSAIVNGITYKQSGSYVQYLKSVNQCDSLLNIQFNLLKSSESSLIQNTCDSTLINGIKYFASGNYLQYLKNSNGCDSILRIELTIKPSTNANLEAGKDTSICQGEMMKLNGIFLGQGNIKWQSSQGSFDNPNSITPIYFPGLVGDDRIYLRATADCGQLVDSLIIHVLPNQVVKVTGDTIIDPCREISFTATGGTNYIWTPSSFIDCLDPLCSKVKLKSTEVTRFTVSTAGPCVVPSNVNLSFAQVQAEIYLPNAFSPNGDIINDLFIPVFNCDQVNYYNLQIFDRWGNLIFETNDKSKGWNGKYQDVNMNPGVYPYVIKYELHNAERKVKSGDITLVR